ncbi:hypothetical protein DESUT3_38190 [Desulfuromonas versatilis]|uniref:Cytochrome c domain-containing protein n=1 Tax=Desulfuromonas versatilis TaxID=2802975 RepID=A0ABM8HXR2_9BACT|nr:SCO family protein [Desulfuromonas versatilis]BCR06750.1 hypothetical protein DESUT3_38190 [Desulfuromonas versatilis]
MHEHHPKRPFDLLALLLFAVLSLVGGPGSAAAGDSPWGADYFPNIPLVSHEGKSLRFFDDLIKDKVVMVNFIYTSCREACPLETARLRQVQKLLGDRVGKDVFMYSISIDPKNDTPEVLKKYAEAYHAGPGWLFLTGNEEEITLLRKKLGVYYEGMQIDNFRDHNISLVIGNQRTGIWVKTSPFENSHVLADKVGSWLHNWKTPSKSRSDYAQAPELRNLSRGETLFRTRCAACHSIGGGDILQSEKGEIGPDLLGVTRTRDRAWLTRWLAEPDQMLAEKDPLAMALLAKYNNLQMPNLSLNQLEVEALIEYMEEESRRVEQSRK